MSDCRIGCYSISNEELVIGSCRDFKPHTEGVENQLAKRERERDAWGKGLTQRTQRCLGHRGELALAEESTELLAVRNEKLAIGSCQDFEPHTEGTETQRVLGHRGERALAEESTELLAMRNEKLAIGSCQDFEPRTEGVENQLAKRERERDAWGKGLTQRAQRQSGRGKSEVKHRRPRRKIGSMVLA